MSSRYADGNARRRKDSFRNVWRSVVKDSKRVWLDYMLIFTEKNWKNKNDTKIYFPNNEAGREFSKKLMMLQYQRVHLTV